MSIVKLRLPLYSILILLGSMTTHEDDGVDCAVVEGDVVEGVDDGGGGAVVI